MARRTHARFFRLLGLVSPPFHDVPRRDRNAIEGYMGGVGGFPDLAVLLDARVCYEPCRYAKCSSRLRLDVSIRK
jgi:hypothetical protein